MSPFSKPSFEDLEIERLNNLLQNTAPTDPTYKVLLERRAELLSSKERQQFRPSPDTILTVVTNIVLAVLIMNYEKTDILTSKAMSFLKRH